MSLWKTLQILNETFWETEEQKIKGAKLANGGSREERVRICKEEGELMTKGGFASW